MVAEVTRNADAVGRHLYDAINSVKHRAANDSSCVSLSVVQYVRAALIGTGGDVEVGGTTLSGYAAA